ncbi:hypothetical protein J2755_000599 [Methanohalophilus levihalophilus]|uniref:DUF2124 family protein n=1 Tax=Methanohalophilus levihalophilus TaxID=1431282 RepID=UPI001AE33F32|nr:DUF2124 family protein [Methanohalophilus levihalophilus]MBP2029679.1 hypothetical protein [Methanohalophilus levihalophilus]
MNVIETSEGLGGMLRGLAEVTRDSKKVIFVGTAGFCTPFAELAAYAMRKNPAELGFIVKDDVDGAKAIIPTDYGMQIGKSIDYHADTVVLLGGLSMSKIGIDIEAANELLANIFEDSDRNLLIGLCFQSTFDVRGWTDKLKFDYLFDADMSVSMKEK